MSPSWPESLEAGGRCVSEEKWIGQLYARLGVAPTESPPCVEVLLRTKLLANLAPGFEIIAQRVPRL